MTAAGEVLGIERHTVRRYVDRGWLVPDVQTDPPLFTQAYIEGEKAKWESGETPAPAGVRTALERARAARKRVDQNATEGP